MNKWRLFLITLLGVVTLSVSAAPEEKTQKAPKTKEKTIKVEEPKRVYMYGVSVNFNDSTVYLTDVQRLDDVIINAEGAIKNHSGYSLQLKVYLEGTLGKVNQTCAVIYSDKKKKLEREDSGGGATYLRTPLDGRAMAFRFCEVQRERASS